MEKNIQKELNESFEDVIQELADFKNKVLKMSATHGGFAVVYNFKHYYPLESKLQRHLKYPQNIQTLQNYVKVLKRFTDKKIKEALPNGFFNRSGFDSLSEEDFREEEERIRQATKKNIDNMVEFISGILNRYKATSIKTIFFNFLTDEESIKKYSKKFSAFESELIKGKLIERTKFFRAIFQGKAPNEKINWTDSASSFRYFINKLFDEEPFKKLKPKWIIASNSFTINGKPVPDNIRAYKDKEVNDKTKQKINVAIEKLYCAPSQSENYMYYI